MGILVVDDEEHLRRMMRLTLEATGYDVTEAADGETGLTLFGDGRRFDATLLDQQMPGMNGLETLGQMKRVRTDACVIMVTAYATIELAIDAMKLGATDFVRKPMTPDTLRHAVAAALAKRDAAPLVGVPEVQQPAQPPGGPVGPLPPLEIWTTNGFFIGRLADEPRRIDPSLAEHLFVVRRAGAGAGVEVAVAIDPKVVAQVARQSRKVLSASGRFWRHQAERALVNHLWREAEVPPAGRLVVSRATGSMLDEAMAWSED